MNDVCMVCGKTRFDSEYQMCPVCGCWNDFVKGKDGVWISGANAVDLVESRKLYKAGRIDRILQRVAFDEKDLHYDDKGLKASMYGMTLEEREYMSHATGGMDFHYKEYSEDELKGVYNKIKAYREDDAEMDKIRGGILEKMEKHME